MNSMELIEQFNNERGWGVFHNEKDLALSICLEASELLEIFQWRSAEAGRQDTEALQDEIADVLIYTYMLADKLGFDIDDLIQRKLAKNAIKYPVEDNRDH